MGERQLRIRARGTTGLVAGAAVTTTGSQPKSSAACPTCVLPSAPAPVARTLIAPGPRNQEPHAFSCRYDLRRLRLHGLIERLPGSNTYVLTHDGIRVALFYTKVHDRLLTPLLIADGPPAPPELQRALRTVDRAVDDYVANARLRSAA